MGYYVYCFEDECFQGKPTEAYVKVVEQMLTDHPELIGEFETYFTTDMSRAEKYTGTTRYVEIAGQKVAIATGFGTAVKRKNLERIEKALYGEKKQTEDKDSQKGTDTVPEAELKAGNDEVEGHENIEEDDDEIVYEDEDDDDEIVYEDEEDEEETDYAVEDNDEFNEAYEGNEESVRDQEGSKTPGSKIIEKENPDEEGKTTVTERVRVWKKPLLKRRGLEYFKWKPTDAWDVCKEEYKYKGEIRYRFAVKKNDFTIFTFAPESGNQSILRAWMWMDRIWMISTNRVDLRGEYLLCSIKVGGRKVDLLASDIGLMNDAYARKDKETELLFVNEDKGEFLWYDMNTKKIRHLVTGISCSKFDHFDREEDKQCRGFQVMADASVLLNQEFLFRKNGEKESIRDYLDCDAILSACKKFFFEEAFLKDRLCFCDNLEKIGVEWVRTDLQDEVKLRLSGIPCDITIPLEKQVVYCDRRDCVCGRQELSLDRKEEYSVKEVLDENPALADLLTGIKKDLKLGYRVGDSDWFSVGYVYAQKHSKILLAIGHKVIKGFRYLGIYDDELEKLSMIPIEKGEGQPDLTEFVSKFRRDASCPDMPRESFHVTKTELEVRYQIDRCGFDVVSFLGDELATFFRNKEIFDSNFERKVVFGKADLRKKILSCVGLFDDKLIYWTYPPESNQREVSLEQITGALLIMDLKGLGYKKPMLVIFNKNFPNRIRVAENKEWQSDRSSWWSSVKDAFQVLKIPAMATERDAAAIVPSLHLPEGVKLKGVHPGFTGGDIEVVRQLDDTVYEGDEINPMNKIYHHWSVSVVFEGKRRGEVTHLRYRNIRAGECCAEGFLYATEQGACFCAQEIHKACWLLESDKVCGVKYLPEKRELQVFLFKDLKQYEFNEHYDVMGYTYEEWVDKYHVDVEMKRFSEDEVVRYLRENNQ